MPVETLCYAMKYEMIGIFSWNEKKYACDMWNEFRLWKSLNGHENITFETHFKI